MKITILLTTIIIIGHLNLTSDFKITQIESDTSVVIEENDDIIIRSINSVSISKDGNKIALIDKSNLYLALYNINNGKLLNYFETSDTLNSYFINNRHYLHSEFQKNFMVISNEWADSLGIGRRAIMNNFKYVKFISNNRIVVGGTFRAAQIDTSDIKRKKASITNIGCFYIFDSNLNIINAYPFESTDLEYSLGTIVFPYSDSSLIVTVSNYLTQNPDSMSLFSLFNMNGKNIKLLSLLPNDYIKIKLYYDLFYQPSICKINNECYWTSGADYKIRKLDNKTYFEIKGFDSTNYYSWLERIKNMKKKSFKIAYNSDPVKLKLTLRSLDCWKDSLIALFSVNNNYNFQLYNSEGKLIRHYILNPPKNHNIEQIVLDSDKNKIIAITYDNNNYYFTIYTIIK